MCIAICSALESDRSALTSLLRRRMCELSADVPLYTFDCIKALLDRFSCQKYVLLFLDADLPDGAGLACARQIRQMAYKGPITFFSANSTSALACYSLHPAGYFVKPFDYAQLCDMLDWHRAALTPYLRSLKVVSARISFDVFLADIRYIEVQGHSCLIHTTSGAITTNRSLATLITALRDAPFLHCHRNYLVNMNHVTGFTPSSLMIGATDAVPLSTDSSAQALKLLAAYRAQLELQTPTPALERHPAL